MIHSSLQLFKIKTIFFLFLWQKLLEYIIYHGASTISVSFWLSWFLDMVSEASVTRGHGFESQPPLIYNGIFSTTYEEGMCCIHTSIPKGSRIRVRVRVYKTSCCLNHQLKLMVEFVPRQMLFALIYEVRFFLGDFFILQQWEPIFLKV